MGKDNEPTAKATGDSVKPVVKERGVFEKVKGSGKWWIRYTGADGKRHQETAGRHGDAIDLLAKRLHEKLLKKKLPEKIRTEKDKITFEDLAKDALLHSREENGARAEHQLEIKLHLIGPDFNHRLAREIVKQDIVKWLLDQTDKRKWSPATRNRYQAAFSLIFRVGVDNQKIDLNPASRIKRKDEDNEHIRYLKREEKEDDRLIAVIKRFWLHYLPAFLISIHTGMRASAQFGLTWRDVSLERRQITRKKTSGKKMPPLPLNDIAFEAFRTLKEQGSGKGYVFLNTKGDRLLDARDWFEPAVEKAGLEDYTWHCNRHTFASWLVMAGVDIRTVAQLMGHRTIQMTMRYAHLAPDHNQSAVDRLASFSREVVATKSATGPFRSSGTAKKN
jgi:integrase